MLDVDAFCDHLVLERGLSERTVDAYRRDLEKLNAFLSARGVHAVRQIGTTELREFV